MSAGGGDTQAREQHTFCIGASRTPDTPPSASPPYTQKRTARCLASQRMSVLWIRSRVRSCQCSEALTASRLSWLERRASGRRYKRESAEGYRARGSERGACAGWPFTAVAHCGHSLRSLTAATHCGRSLRPLTAVAHCGHSLRPLTAVAHCGHSLRPLTAATHCVASASCAGQAPATVRHSS